MKVFHLTYWYANQRNPSEGIWISRHIQALNPYVEDQHVYHLEITRGDRFYFSNTKIHEKHSAFRLSAPIPWWLIEVLNFLGLVWVLLVKARRYNVVNVHIAYPLLTYLHVLKRIFRTRIVITEHWSAYHFNFGVRRDLHRIQRVFENDLPLITVSVSLRLDIEKFSRRTFSQATVIPNAVDSSIFTQDGITKPEGNVFFMLSHWKWPKRPELIIEALAELIQLREYSDFQLRIGGTGPQLAEMKNLVSTTGLTNNVIFLGSLSPTTVAWEMNMCSALLHSSEYETFSVVCAEAICCGTPVIASAVGGIPEFINEGNGILIQENSVEAWVRGLKGFDRLNYDRKQVSNAAHQRFSLEAVGYQYFNFLTGL